MDKLQGGNFDPAQILGIFGFSVIIYYAITFLFASIWGSGAIGSAVEAVCHGQSSIGSFFRTGFRYAFKMLGLTFLMFLTYIPFLLFFFGAIISFANKSLVIGSILVILALAAYFVPVLAFMNAPIILIAENEKVFRSISQSFRLLREQFGTVFLTFLGILGIWGVASIIDLILGFLAETSSIIAFFVFLLIIPFWVYVITVNNLFIAHRYQNRLRGQLYPGSGPAADANWQGQGHGYGDAPRQQGPATGFGSGYNPGLNPQGQTWQQPSQPAQPPMGSPSVSWGQPNQPPTGSQSGAWGQSHQPSTPPSGGSGAQTGGSQPQQPSQQPSSGPQFQSPFQPSFTFNPNQQQGKPSWQMPQPSQPQSTQPSQQPQPEKPSQPPRYPRQQ